MTPVPTYVLIGGNRFVATSVVADDGNTYFTVVDELKNAGDVASTLANGRKTVTTPGTAVPIVAGATPCKWVLLTALTSNLQQVNVGGTGVLAASGSSTGTPLLPGQSATLPVDDATKVFVDARATGEGVSFTVAT